MKNLSSLPITNDYFKNIDLSTKKTEIINFLKKIPNLNFNEKSVWESRYWGKGIGAFQLEGYFKNQPSIIKIQGSKPLISENEILRKLNLATTIKIKFPKVLFYQPWIKKLQFEVVIFEKINADFIIKSHQLTTKNQLKEFFQAYQYYKSFTKKLTPFLEKPEFFDYFKLFNKWRKIRLENKYQDLISIEEDKFLITTAKKISLAFKKLPLEFQHCHLSIYDIKKQNNQYYLFSNLFWGWRWPYYDAVFGFVWYLLGLADFEKQKIVHQINLWENFIFNLDKNYVNLINLALIERYLAALNLDILMINDKNKIIKIKKILFDQIKRKLNQFNL